MRRRKKTLIPSILALFEYLDVKAWVYENRVAHNGSDELREEIGENIERMRATGARGKTLLFGAVLLSAVDRGFTEQDSRRLDALGQGNYSYLLEKLKEGDHVERKD